MLLASQSATRAGEVDVISPDSVSTYTEYFYVPRGVYFISAAVIGGGGGGAAGSRGPYPSGFPTRPAAGGAGGGGAALSYANDLPVEPGDTIELTIGAGGQGGSYTSATTEVGATGFTGGLTYIRRNGSTILSAGGGGGGERPVFQGGSYVVWYAGSGGSGGSGGIGGDGGATGQDFFAGEENYMQQGGGGGGPGGWGGSGGNGRGINQSNSPPTILEATLGELGGGAGGGNSGSTAYFGAYGSSSSWPYLGTGAGIINSVATSAAGAGAGGPGSGNGATASGRQGRAGRARIMWNGPGVNRSYPNG
jgi:hypothetical protein